MGNVSAAQLCSLGDWGAQPGGTGEHDDPATDDDIDGCALARTTTVERVTSLLKSKLWQGLSGTQLKVPPPTHTHVYVGVGLRRKHVRLCVVHRRARCMRSAMGGRNAGCAQET